MAARGASAGATRIIGDGPRAGEEIPVDVPTYVAALYDFEDGGVAQATFSFDSPLKRIGVMEFAGTEATIVAPDPNDFTGEISISRGEAGMGVDPGDRASPGGRGIGAVDMARAIRAGGPHRATGRLAPARPGHDARHRGIDRDRGVRPGRSRFDPIPALPEDWDPTAATL